VGNRGRKCCLLGRRRAPSSRPRRCGDHACRRAAQVHKPGTGPLEARVHTRQSDRDRRMARVGIRPLVRL
jgi:hypothetical protein